MCGLGMHLPVTSGLRQEVQLSLPYPNTYADSSFIAGSLQGYHGVIHDNLADND